MLAVLAVGALGGWLAATGRLPLLARSGAAPPTEVASPATAGSCCEGADRGTLLAMANPATAALPLIAGHAADSGKKPNILFIMGDDIGWFNVGAYHRGMMSGKTPNLDKLASQGAMLKAKGKPNQIVFWSRQVDWKNQTLTPKPRHDLLHALLQHDVGPMVLEIPPADGGREPMPIDKQIVIRANRNTLYSVDVFDLDAGEVTITPPDAGKRFVSLQVIDEDQYCPSVFYGEGKHALTREQIGTRYVVTAVCMLVDPWNYRVRLYRPRAEILNGTWKFPEARPVQ